MVENLKFDSHLEASRLRDYSGYSDHSAMSASTLKVPSTAAATATNTTADEDQDVTANLATHQAEDDLAQRLQANKAAINKQLNEDFIGDEEFLAVQQSQQQQQQQHQGVNFSSGESNLIQQQSLLSSPLTIQQDSGVASTISTDLSRRSSIVSSNTITSISSAATATTSATASSQSTTVSPPSALPTIKITKYDINYYMFFFRG
jgi:hypothetical protein